MTALKTLFRAVVMIATGIAVVKAWSLYGPTNEQCKSFALSAWEKAEVAWHEWRETPPANAPASDPRVLLAQEPQPVGAASAVTAAPPAVASAPAVEVMAPPLAIGAPAAVPPPSVAASAPASSNTDAVAELLTRLEAIGGADAKVAAWGSSGELYRCCCQARMSEESAIARHFEAVAAEPAAAVEQVVAKVEAWRTQQQQLLR